jgi:diaminopimelate decarboxylase
LQLLRKLCTLSSVSTATNEDKALAFSFRNGKLWIGSEANGQNVLDLARKHEGPVYIYDLNDVIERTRRLKSALGQLKTSIHYAVKANANSQILKALAQEGVGVDTVSGGEIQAALENGFTADRVIFSGVGKTKKEIELAISKDIKQINVESPAELERIAEIAKKLGRRPSVAFRMNPDVNPQTHPYITTGFRENKFGMDVSFLPELKGILKKNTEHLRLRGVTLHIGSQLLELGSMREAIQKTIQVYKELQSEGFEVDRFDVGGGLGIQYATDDTSSEFKMIDDYGKMVQELLAPLKCEVLLEPGRILVARAGILVGEVQYIKSTQFKNFAIINTGMHHLLRPALYQAKHRILAVVSPTNVQHKKYDVVGPICESSDFLGKEIDLPELQSGDYLAIMDAGAYGYSMANNYNRHDLPFEIVLKS